LCAEYKEIDLVCQIEYNVMGLWSQLSGFSQRIPQYVEVPPNIEAKSIGSPFPALLPIHVIHCYYRMIPDSFLFRVLAGHLQLQLA